jgi:CopG family nickel-responsive transcriptional regulator
VAEVERFSVSMAPELLKAFDAYRRRRGYRTRSEGIRDAIRRELVEAEWQDSDREVVGTVTLIYDHATRELTRVLTDIQHTHHGTIICTTHVHLDGHNCLEVVVLKGPARQVQTIADRLIASRGVKHGRLVSTSTGKRLA